MKRDYYRILGISRKVDEREVRRAYLKLARKYHPDVNPGDGQVVVLFKEIQEAYHVLVNPAARKLYDRKGEVPPAGGSKERARQAASSDARGWEKIIHDVFHGEEPDTAEAGADKGESLHQVLEVSFAESLKGAKRQIAYQREAVCTGCGGGRFAPGSRRSECGDCGGSGLVRVRRGPYLVNKICPRCFGGGEVSSRLCPDCGGKGRRLVTERKTVRVPVGSDSGSTIEIAGGGQPGKRGGPNGSLLVTLRVQPHPAIAPREVLRRWGASSGSGPFQYASDLVRFVQQSFPDEFHIEVACYPEFHPESASPETEFKYFKEKIDAGADGATTQYFYNTDCYFQFLDDCQRNGIDVPITPRDHADYQLQQPGQVFRYVRY